MDLAELPGTAFRRHPWEVARARFFRRVLAEAGVLDRRRAILDVGAGDGYLARGLLDALPAGSEVVCVDAHYGDEDLRRFQAAAPAGLSFVRERPAGRRFDVLMLLDVIEHVPDDRAFLGELVGGGVAPSGAVLVSVPAWQPLFSAHDVALKHYRRYSPAACRELLAGAGLTLRRSGGLFHSLLAPRVLTLGREALLRRLGRLPPPPPDLGEWRGGRAVSAALAGVLAADNALSHALARLGAGGVPGLSFWALAAAPPETETGA
jgi:SAM-dependent methyltransferase